MPPVVDESVLSDGGIKVDQSGATLTIAINSVASALIFGLTPMRTEENTFIGKVVDDGPETKLEITRSSSDSVNASSQPEASAGAMIVAGAQAKKKSGE